MTKIPPKVQTVPTTAPPTETPTPAKTEGPTQQGGSQQVQDGVDRRQQRPNLNPDPASGRTIQQADPLLPKVIPGIGQVPIRGGDKSQHPSTHQFPDGPIVEMRPPDGPIVEMRPPDDTSQYKTRIEWSLSTLDRAAKLAEAPDVSSMVHVFIRDKRPVDGERLDAYVEPHMGRFYLKSTGAGMGGPQTIGPFWYGPIDLAKRPPDGPIVEMRPPDGPIVEMRPPDGPIVEMRPPDDGGSGQVPGPIVEMRPPDRDDD